MSLPEFIFLFTCVVLAVYIPTIGYIESGWRKLKPFSSLTRPQPLANLPLISVIIPFRNEEHHLTKLLDHLHKQTLAKDQFEIILVDDHSEDASQEVIRNHPSEFPKLRVLSLNESQAGTGKKAALHHGVVNASGELIVTTDADCLPHFKWLETVAAFYQVNDPDLILGPVFFAPLKNWFEKLQALDFLALIGTTAYSAGLGNPLMANAANMAFKKSTYLKLQPAFNALDHPSGDDVFLVHRFKSDPDVKVEYLLAKNAVVTTYPEKTWASFWHQRVRWASKARRYKDSLTSFTGFIVFFANVTILAPMVMLFFYPSRWELLLVPIGLKWFFDLTFLLPIMTFFRQLPLLIFFLPLQILYPFYITFTGIRSIVGTFNWKGRNYG